MNWTEYFLSMAHLVKEKSKDPSTKVGCVIVGPDNEIVSTGFNGFPRGVNELDVTRWERPIKYLRSEHAERNAIYNAARIGVSTKGCVAYVQAFPCSDCARAMIQAGIVLIVIDAHDPLKNRADWREHMDVAESMLIEAGVAVKVYDREKQEFVMSY